MVLPTYEQFMNGLAGIARNEATYCVICTDLCETPFGTSCGHHYCTECAQKWFTISCTCPACRKVVYDKTTIPPDWKRDLATFDFDRSLQFWADRTAVEARIAEFAAGSLPPRYHSGRIRMNAKKFTNAALGAMIHLRGQALYETRCMVSPLYAWTDEYEDIYIGVIHKIEAFVRPRNRTFYEANKLKKDINQWLWPNLRQERKTSRDSLDTVRFHLLNEDAEYESPEDFSCVDEASPYSGFEPEEQLREQELDFWHHDNGERVLSDIHRIIDFAIEHSVKDQKSK